MTVAIGMVEESVGAEEISVALVDDVLVTLPAAALSVELTVAVSVEVVDELSQLVDEV